MVRAQPFDMEDCKDVAVLGSYPMAQFFMDNDSQSYCWQLREGDSLVNLLARYMQWPDGRSLPSSIADAERDTRFFVHRGADHFSLHPDPVPPQEATALFPMKAPLFAGDEIPEDLTIRVLRRKA